LNLFVKVEITLLLLLEFQLELEPWEVEEMCLGPIFFKEYQNIIMMSPFLYSFT
jgi:hypothetical protein